MTDLPNTIAIFLIRELEGFQRELELFPDDESVWKTVPGVTNSAGNLALHLAGNLQYYVGAVLGGTHYIRNREDEFSRRSGTRNQLVLEIQATMRTVRAVVPSLPPDTFGRVFPEKVFGRDLRTDRFLLHLCTHAAYHLAQAGYLRRIVTGLNQTSGAIPLAPLETGIRRTS
jgi:hypothetical protein